MIEALSQMLWPLLACFVLVGIHAYLGIHVIARKVIFVDLALAQIAALGAVYGVFVGLSFEHDPWAIKAISVSFTFMGALLFSFTRSPNDRVPHEAIIGIIYAAALSATLLITANLPHGDEEVAQMLAGNILWVTPQEVLHTAVLYCIVGFIHIIFRKQFFSLSKEIEVTSETTLNAKLWDFLFYATFGVVVTSSVGIGGVLLVFGYLVIPSVIGVILARSMKNRLLIGWGSGVVISLLGVIVSYYLDLPSGPTIVVMLGVLLTLITISQELSKKSLRKKGIVHVVIIVAVLAVVILTPILFLIKKDRLHHESKARMHSLSHAGNDNEQAELLKKSLSSENTDEILKALQVIKDKELTSLSASVVPFLEARDDKIRALAVEVVKKLHDKAAKPHLMLAIAHEQDEFIKIEMALALLPLGAKEGLFELQKIAMHGSEFAKVDAITHLQEWLIDAPMEKTALLKWLRHNREKIVFDEAEKKFYVPKQ